MKTYLAIAAIAVLALATPLYAGDIRGQYIEARTTDVWTGPCFANADMNLTGKHAVLAWKIEQGRQDGVVLDGLSVVAVVEASDTLGLTQTGPAKAVLLVDKKADATQRAALVALAKKLGGDLTQNVVAVVTTPISITAGHCEKEGCARVDAGVAKIETRCLHDKHDKVCGNEDEFYPPLSVGAKAKAALVTEHSYTGKGFNKTWTDRERRGAYVGSFSIQ